MMLRVSECLPIKPCVKIFGQNRPPVFVFLFIFLLVFPICICISLGDCISYLNGLWTVAMVEGPVCPRLTAAAGSQPPLKRNTSCICVVFYLYLYLYLYFQFALEEASDTAVAS